MKADCSKWIACDIKAKCTKCRKEARYIMAIDQAEVDRIKAAKKAGTFVCEDCEKGGGA